MTSFLSSTGRSLDCLLPKPWLMSQSLYNVVSDVHPAPHDGTESADSLLGAVKLTPVKVILKPTFLNIRFMFCLKVRQKLVEKQMTEERLEKVRKLREMKKFGKKVQIEVQQKREKEKRDMLEEVRAFFDRV